jgi:hypothetical protein
MNPLTMSDISNSFKPLFFMSKMFGLMPLSFSLLDIGTGEAFSFRLSDVFFLTVWILALLTMFGCNLYYATHSFSNVTKKIKIMYIIYSFFFSFTKIFVIVTTNFTNIGNIIKLLKKVLTIDQFIDRRSRIHMYKKIRSQILKTVAVGLIIQLILCPVSFFMETSSESVIMMILWSSVQHLCFTFNIVLSVEYVSIVHMLKCWYEYFNCILLEYFNKKCMTTEPPSKYKNVSLSVNIDYIELPALSGRDLTGPTRALHGHHNISYLRMIYLNMYDCVTLINSYFGFPILLETVSMAIMCVSALYYAVYTLDFDGDLSVSRLSTYITSGYLTTCCILYLLIFAWMVVCCHNTTQESNKGIYFIHRISLDRDIHYSTITELDKLLRQLINLRVQFTACGLFALNPTFLCTILSVILTYILIMFQLS